MSMMVDGYLTLQLQNEFARKRTAEKSFSLPAFWEAYQGWILIGAAVLVVFFLLGLIGRLLNKRVSAVLRPR